MGNHSSSDSKTYLVRIKTGSTEYEGILFSLYPGKRLSEALSRMDQFLNLKDALDCNTKEKYPFVVISKNTIETIIVLSERQGEASPPALEET